LQIACPRCAAAYSLDERLLPPAGAPVQCTSCNHVFNAIPPAPTAANARSTQVFGKADLPQMPAPPSAARSTQVLGKVELPRTTSGAQTPASAAPPTHDPARSTQVLGRVELPRTTSGAGFPAGAATPTQAPARATQVLGKVELPPRTASGSGMPASSPAHDPARSTAMFGKVELPPRTTPAQGTPGGATTPAQNPAHSTQMFGKLDLPARTASGSGIPAGAAPAHDPSRSTAMFGKVDLPPRTTPAQGSASSAAPPAAHDPARSTQMFGKLDLPPRTTSAPGSIPAAQAAHSTRMFGNLDLPSSEGLSSNDRATAPSAGAPTPLDAAPAHQTMIFGRRDSLPSIPKPLPIDLEPAASSAPASTIGGGLGWWWALLLTLVALSGLLALRISAKRAQEAAALARDDQAALALLHIDDAIARHQAQTALGELLRRAPDDVVARADRALMMALDEDDALAPLAALDYEQKALDKEAAALEQAKATGDWQVRVNALRAQQKTVDQTSHALRGEADAKAKEITGVLAQLPAPNMASTDANRAIVRATALAAAIRGDAQAIVLTERYLQLGGDQQWVEQLSAEFAASGRAMTPAMEGALNQMNELQKRDPSAVRAYVLGARIALLLGRVDEAVSRLEAATALNPNHGLAHRLLTALRENEVPPAPGEGQ
jgi:predicted Zn finger-like uncharacterized protein